MNTRDRVKQMSSLLNLTESRLRKTDNLLTETLHLGGDPTQPTRDEAERTGIGRLALSMEPSFGHLADVNKNVPELIGTFKDHEDNGNAPVHENDDAPAACGNCKVSFPSHQVVDSNSQPIGDPMCRPCADEVSSRKHAHFIKRDTANMSQNELRWLPWRMQNEDVFTEEFIVSRHHDVHQKYESKHTDPRSAVESANKVANFHGGVSFVHDTQHGHSYAYWGSSKVQPALVTKKGISACEGCGSDVAVGRPKYNKGEAVFNEHWCPYCGTTRAKNESVYFEAIYLQEPPRDNTHTDMLGDPVPHWAIESQPALSHVHPYSVVTGGTDRDRVITPHTSHHITYHEAVDKADELHAKGHRHIRVRNNRGGYDVRFPHVDKVSGDRKGYTQYFSGIKEDKEVPTVVNMGLLETVSVDVCNNCGTMDGNPTKHSGSCSKECKAAYIADSNKAIKLGIKKDCNCKSGCSCDSGFDNHSESVEAGVTKGKETKFHKKLDKLVHTTFGKRKDEAFAEPSMNNPAFLGNAALNDVACNQPANPDYDGAMVKPKDRKGTYATPNNTMGGVAPDTTDIHSLGDPALWACFKEEFSKEDALLHLEAYGIDETAAATVYEQQMDTLVEEFKAYLISLLEMRSIRKRGRNMLHRTFTTK